MPHLWILNHHAHGPTTGKWLRHFLLSRQLVQRGWQITIIAASFEHGEGKQYSHWRQGVRIEEYDGVRFARLSTNRYSGNGIGRIVNYSAYTVQALRWGLVKQLGRPDLVMGTSAHLLAAWAGGRIARRLRVPFLFEVRDLWPLTFIEFGLLSPNGLPARVLSVLERNLYRQADRIVTVLPRASDYIQQLGEPADKISWIPNGVDFDTIPVATMPVRREFFTVMYAGAHGIANDLQPTLEAAALLQADGRARRIRFRFVGDGPDKARLISWAREHRLENVTFDAGVPKRDVFDALSQADAFIMSSKRSPLYKWGISYNKLFDYMAAARPIIYAIDSEYDPIAEAGSGVSIPAGDPGAIVAAVKKLAALSLEERWQMGLRAREFAENHHNIRTLADKLEAVLLEVHEAPQPLPARRRPAL